MNSFFDGELCDSGKDICRKCRRARDYRRGIIASFNEPTDVDFECPKGKTVEDFPQDIEPNIFQIGVNFARAMTAEAKQRMRPVGSNANRVPPEKVENRLATCRDCEFFVNNKKCAKCGCYMGFKARLKTGKCPIGKW